MKNLHAFDDFHNMNDCHCTVFVLLSADGGRQVYIWKALRLIAKSKLHYFSKMENGNLEPVLRLEQMIDDKKQLQVLVDCFTSLPSLSLSLSLSYSRFHSFTCNSGKLGL
jgi:hypothetical protein